jgi:hypothetical protein
MLADIIAGNRDEIITRYRAKASIKSLRIPLDAESEYTALVFLDELLSTLRFGSKPDSDDGSAVQPLADDVLEEPLIVPRIAQYGEITQSITELAMEMNAPVNVAELATLDRSVDEATARAVTKSVSERGQIAHAAVPGDSDRLRVFRHEVRKLVNTAILSFDFIRTGRVGLQGSTGRLLNRSLIELRSLVDRVDSNAD